MKFSCKICGNIDNNEFYKVREMQFGMRDEFTYCLCGGCGCLQLVDPPEDLSKYYPENYFSFQKVSGNKIKEKLNVFRDRHSLGSENLLGKILYNKYGQPTYAGWLKSTGVNFNSRIVDIGCGAGKLLYRMGNTGFKNLLGIDPFIDTDIHYKNGVNILKKDLFNLDEKFDLVMMHHSLEHMEDQHAVFGKLNEIVTEGKILLIRIPICSSFAWEKYREDWFALEAPRHFFNHSEKSLSLLADKYGFEIFKTLYDSRSIQLWGSEQYRRNIPLIDERSYFVNPDASVFSDTEILRFEEETRRLNNTGRGDQGVFFLRKK